MNDTQPQTQQTNEIKSSLFTYLIILTTLFLFLEISYFIQRSDIYLGDYKLAADHLGIPHAVIPGILYFIFVQLSLHFIFAVVVWGMARLISVPLKLAWIGTEKLGIALWFLGLATILFANEYFFPNSKFAGLINWVILPGVVEYFLILTLGLLLAAAVVAVWGFFLVSSKQLKGILAVASTLVIIIYVAHPAKASMVTDASTADKPNVILIGMDALRPDFLGFFGYSQHTPHIDEFFNQSAVFANSLTAIARTFPSWVTILTGEYPKKNGVRFNLPTMDSTWHFGWDTTLPAILRQHGYKTMFGTDEVRFSNIDERFGFDQIVTPPVGFNDFLLGTLNDFPMANLLVNTRVGKYLFPHSFGNRPAFSTYDPDSFLALLQPALAQPREKPLFLAVHFCLPHFPYFWGTHRLYDRSIDNYRAAVHRVDQQFNDFLTMLKQNKVLDHAMVVVLSDHGEAIELRGDRVTNAELFIPGPDNDKKIIPHFYPKSFDTETVDQSAGHGTDILGMTQYHTVLAMRLFGTKSNQTIIIPNQVSLLDIKPTILEFLHVPIPAKDDGIARTNLILGEKDSSSQKDFFMETDYSPQAIRSVHPETRKLLFEGIEFFQVDPKTTRLTVKKNMAQLIISSKQYADIYGNWILALYPQSKTIMMPILVNLETGKWTNDLRTSFAKTSPAAHMLHELKQFYGSDISQVENTIPS